MSSAMIWKWDQSRKKSLLDEAVLGSEVLGGGVEDLPATEGGLADLA